MSRDDLITLGVRAADRLEGKQRRKNYEPPRPILAFDLNEVDRLCQAARGMYLHGEDVLVIDSLLDVVAEIQRAIKYVEDRAEGAQRQIYAGRSRLHRGSDE